MDEAEIQQAVADYANAVGCSVSVDIDYWTHIHPFSTKSHTEYSLWVSSTNCRYKYKSIDELVQSVRQKTILMKKF